MKRILLLMALVLPMMAYGQNSVTVESPDKSISMTFASVRGELKYKVKYGKNEVVSYSSVALDTDKGLIGENVRFGKVTRNAGVEEYDLPVGKTSHVKSPWQDAVIPLIDKNGCGLDVSVHVRVFNDAAAYRLVFKASGEDEDIRIRNEVMDVNVTGNPMATALFFDHFINTHEGLYTRKNVTDLDENRLIDMPTHFEFADGTQMAVTEASIINYAGMYLTKKNGRLTSRLSPRLDVPQFSVLLKGEGQTPWRVFMLGDHVATLMESTVLTSLCEPCKIEDTSWLKPGKTTFPWWNDTVMPDDTPFQAGNNFLTNKHYIDFAADHGLEYHSVYGYADMPWYYDNGPGFGQAGPDADLTRHDPRLDFPAVCRYARSRGVDIHVWLNWAALYKDIDRVFDKFNE
ncbi:MAG: glycoside hydrolase family 97 protein, partial [Bacteroidales bacterium]|nr:glycoside hydrolase family 97 protein [Bacteroidales bacterium]